MLLRWRNENRQAFVNDAVINDVAHAAWFARQRLDPYEAVYIVDVVGTPFGTISVTDHGNYSPLHQQHFAAEIGRVMLGDKSYARKNYMSTALWAIVDRYSDGLRRLLLRVKTDNAIAIGFYKKAGFVTDSSADDGGAVRMSYPCIPPVATTFDVVANRYGCDKGAGHFYGRWYVELIRNSPKRILEIGVHTGASLHVWNAFFSPDKIVGVDIDPACANVSRPPNASIVIGSQADAAFLATLGLKQGPFDLIVDDGSHNPADMRVSRSTLWPFLAPGGVYVIEDIEFDSDIPALFQDGAQPAEIQLRRSVTGRAILFLFKV